MLKRIYRQVLKFFRSRKTYQYNYVEEEPDELSSGTIYIVQNEGFNWQIVMQCPCGCKQAIQLNLMEGSSPQWKFFIEKDNKISLKPSIWRTVGCESHFFVREGKIAWCK